MRMALAEALARPLGGQGKLICIAREVANGRVSSSSKTFAFFGLDCLVWGPEQKTHNCA
jgi:hypothetical protein